MSNYPSQKFSLKNETYMISVADLFNSRLLDAFAKGDFPINPLESTMKIRYFPRESTKDRIRETIVPVSTVFPEGIETLAMSYEIRVPLIQMSMKNNFLPDERFKTGRDGPLFLLHPDYSISCEIIGSHEEERERVNSVDSIKRIITRLYDEVALLGSAVRIPQA
ncbi:MAG: hypothetical protein Q8Q31_00620 [Nanoarchaeota archaeon]|nr:hypothetical protein [Nanoarchaeota archaeon]